MIVNGLNVIQGEKTMKVYEIECTNEDSPELIALIWIASEFPIKTKDKQYLVREIAIDPNDPRIDFVIEAKGDKQ